MKVIVITVTMTIVMTMKRDHHPQMVQIVWLPMIIDVHWETLEAAAIWKMMPRLSTWTQFQRDQQMMAMRVKPQKQNELVRLMKWLPGGLKTSWLHLHAERMLKQCY